MSRYTEICGCVHIHFPLKKLGKTLEPAGKEGHLAGLDFIVINSHTPQKYPAKYEQLFSKEGYHGKTLVINAEETRDKKKKNHILLVGGDRWRGNKADTAEVLSDAHKDGCLSFIAHPYGFHKLHLVKKDYRWENWQTDGFTGIEIWSMLFDWAKSTRIYNLPAKYLSFPQNLKGPDNATLKRWDSLSMEKKVVGIAGLDIHSLPVFLKPFDIWKKFDYRKVFRTLRNHILLKEPLSGNPDTDKQKILDGMKKGSLFFSNDKLADSSGFYFGDAEENLIMGDAVPLNTPLTVKTPVNAHIKIIFNGHIAYEAENKNCLFFRADKHGVYRVEAEIQKKPWIFSNHIRTLS